MTKLSLRLSQAQILDADHTQLTTEWEDTHESPEWYSYFEQQYLGSYSAITAGLRIVRNRYHTRQGIRRRTVAVWIDPKTGRYGSSPLTLWLRQWRTGISPISGKPMDLSNMTVREQQHLKQHIEAKVMAKHKAQVTFRGKQRGRKTR